ncbi:MAG TPA: MHYT domain-containing protein [Actinospica sp.]|nr:MHYT domain-containing protein [Actinospica sp.]
MAIGGSGIWVMHFIAMLGYSLPIVQISYSLPVTLVSLLVAVTVLWFGLRFTLRGGSIGSVIPGGVVTGVGVAGMHYLGMAAMDVSASVHYRVWVVALSVLMAVTAATVALWFAANLDSAAAMLGAAVGHGGGGVRDALHRDGRDGCHGVLIDDRHGAYLDPAPGTARGRRQYLDVRDRVDDRPQSERAGDRTGGRDQGEPSQTRLDARGSLTPVHITCRSGGQPWRPVGRWTCCFGRR